MLMAFFPTRFTVNSFMSWAGISKRRWRMPARPDVSRDEALSNAQDTMRVNRDAANPLSDNELQSLHIPCCCSSVMAK